MGSRFAYWEGGVGILGVLGRVFWGLGVLFVYGIWVRVRWGKRWVGLMGLCVSGNFIIVIRFLGFG